MTSENNTQDNNILSSIKKNIKTIKSSNDIFQNQYQYNNCHLLSRKDTMYLSSLNSNDFPIRKFRQMPSKREWSLNLYNLDIQGSSPRKFGLLTKKIDFTNNNKDIEKSSPSQLFKKVIPNYSLSCKDIQGATPHHLKSHIVRCTNPLNPKYNLPKTETTKQEENIDNNKKPKFIKDNLKIDDIEGARPKKIGNFFLRNNMNKDDIKGSFPRPRYVRKEFFNSIDYSDIQKIKHKRKKDLNPLNPVYNWNYSINNVNYNVGPIEKNQPKPFSDIKYKFPYNLSNEDIEGSKPGSKNKFRIFKGSNSCLNIGDINGAIHGSLLKGIKTKRNLNPLTPNYRYLGEEELKSQEKILFDNKNLNKSNKVIKTSSFNLSNSINLPKITINEEAIKNKNNKNIVPINTTGITSNPKIQNQTDIDNKINQMLSDLNENPSNGNKPIFDKNLYKRPEIYYPLKHDKNIVFINEGHKNNKNPNPNLRSFQRIIDTKIKLLDFKNNNLDFNNENKPFESKMDDFLVNLSIDLKNSQQRLLDNINAYYDIGFPDELKDKELLNNL
jgi:hypothetical protein